MVTQVRLGHGGEAEGGAQPAQSPMGRRALSREHEVRGHRQHDGGAGDGQDAVELAEPDPEGEEP